MGRVPVVEAEVRRLAAVEEGSSLLKDADPFGPTRHDHASMISSPRAADSFPGGPVPPSGPCAVGQDCHWRAVQPNGILGQAHHR